MKQNILKIKKQKGKKLFSVCLHFTKQENNVIKNSVSTNILYAENEDEAFIKSFGAAENVDGYRLNITIIAEVKFI